VIVNDAVSLCASEATLLCTVRVEGLRTAGSRDVRDARRERVRHDYALCGTGTLVAHAQGPGRDTVQRTGLRQDKVSALHGLIGGRVSGRPSASMLWLCAPPSDHGCSSTASAGNGRRAFAASPLRLLASTALGAAQRPDADRGDRSFHDQAAVRTTTRIRPEELSAP
jgi:hypothetical protein